MSISFAQALDLLRTNPSAYTTTDALLKLASEVSIETTGKITVLYSGNMSNGTSANNVIEAMVANSEDVRVINKTPAAEFLNSREFKDAVARAHGITLKEMSATLNPTDAAKAANAWLYDGKSGPWAETSKRFMDATVGEVRIMTTSPRLTSVLYETEIPVLLEKLKTSTSITEVDGLSRADLLKVGAAYSTNWSDAMRNTVLNNVFTQTHLSKPTPGNFNTYLNMTPEGLNNLYKTAHADDIAQLFKYQAAFNIPPAATKVLNKLGVVGGLVAFGLASTQAAQAQETGDSEKAQEIMKQWAADAAGSEVGAAIGSSIAAIALGLAAAAGVTVSAPVAGAALLGGILGGDVAADLYQLTKDLDGNGRMDLLDKLAGWLFGEEILSLLEKLRGAFMSAQKSSSPIVLDLDGDGVETTAVLGATHFDYAGDGFAESTGWAERDDGLLALDRNGNGQIDNGVELFGGDTLLLDGTTAANGFEALRELDTNGDGRIDALDAAYGDLRVWRDLNRDGSSQSDELLSLEQAGVRSINVDYETSAQIDENGNAHRQVGSFQRSDGSTGAATDVWFAVDPMYSEAVQRVEVPQELLALPGLAGSGVVHGLHQAMALDASGELEQLVRAYVGEDDAIARRALLDDLLFLWSGADTMAADSRGANVDACQLHVLEAFFGEAFKGGTAIQARALALN
jgi:hypothetical protein